MPDFKKTLKIIDCWIRNVNYKIYLQVFGVMTFFVIVVNCPEKLEEYWSCFFIWCLKFSKHSRMLFCGVSDLEKIYLSDIFLCIAIIFL